MYPARLALTIAAALLVAAPATASAHSTAESLAVADTYWSGHHCAGRVEVTVADDLGTHDGKRIEGLATGLAPHWHASEQRWHWHLERCTIAIRADLTEQRECFVIWHEVTHLALQDGDHAHDTLSYSHPGPEACRDHGHGDVTKAASVEPKPITAAQRAYRERKHRWYHERSKHPDRVALAMKWHDPGNARRAIEHSSV